MKPLLPILVRLEDGTMREATERELEERVALIKRARKAKTDLALQHVRESLERRAAASQPRGYDHVNAEAINAFLLDWMLHYQREHGAIAAAAVEFQCPEDVIRRRMTLRLPSD